MASTLRKSDLKNATVGYLHSDGHLVLIHEKRDPDAGRVQYATIHEAVARVSIRRPATTEGGYPTPLPDGRIIFHEGALPLLLHAERVEGVLPATGYGSAKSKALNIAVGGVSIYFTGQDSYSGFHIALTPDVISAPFTVQDRNGEPFAHVAEKRHWGDVRIKEVRTTNGVTVTV